MFLSGPRREYKSQEAVLEAVREASGYATDEAVYRLVRADVAQDSIIFQYRGVKHPGDSAWVIQFSQKSTEQSPAELADLGTLLEALARGKEGFQKGDREEKVYRDRKVEFARYGYLSILRNNRGQQVQAAGITAVTRVDADPAPLIYQLKVENMEGDRADIGWPDLVPLLDAIPQ